MRTDLPPDHPSQLATVQRTDSSTRIGGAKLEDAEIARLIERLRTLHSRDEQVAAGYYLHLGIILEGYAAIPVSSSVIMELPKQ